MQYKFLNSPLTGKTLEMNSSNHYVTESEHLHTVQKPRYNFCFILYFFIYFYMIEFNGYHSIYLGTVLYVCLAIQCKCMCKINSVSLAPQSMNTLYKPVMYLDHYISNNYLNQ